jgi:hypothetical protein
VTNLKGDDECKKVLDALSDEEYQTLKGDMDHNGYIDKTKNDAKIEVGVNRYNDGGCNAPYSIGASGFVVNLSVSTYDKDLTEKIYSIINTDLKDSEVEFNPDIKVNKESKYNTVADATIKTNIQNNKLTNIVLRSILVSLVLAFGTALFASFIRKEIQTRKGTK